MRANKKNKPKEKIAVVVLNSVSHDARVLKEAETLSKAGYDVVVVGIRDNRNNTPEEILEHKTRIIRAAWRANKELIHLRMWLFFMVVISVLFCSYFFFIRSEMLGFQANLITFMMYQTLVSFGSFLYKNFTILLANMRSHPDSSIIVLLWFVFMIKSLRSSRSRYKQYLKFKALEEGLPEMEKRWLGWIPSLREIKNILRTNIHHKVLRHAIFKELLKIRPDIIHCHDLISLPIGCRYKKNMGCTLVYDSHEIYEESALTTPWARIYNTRLQQSLSKHVDHFITVNNSIGDYLNKKYPLLPKAVIVKNAAISINFSSLAPYDGRLHQAAQIPKDKKILLYHGGFSVGRGLEQLIQAAPLLPYGWVLVLLGWGDLEKLLKKKANLLDPDGMKVRFLPPVPFSELPQWIRGASLGVIAYKNICLNHWFCTPNKLWEYPAAGVPILASPFPEIRKVVEQEEIGWLLDDPIIPQNISNLVRMIPENELESKQKKGFEFISHDNWSRYEKRMVDLYLRMDSIH